MHPTCHHWSDLETCHAQAASGALTDASQRPLEALSPSPEQAPQADAASIPAAGNTHPRSAADSPAQPSTAPDQQAPSSSAQAHSAQPAAAPLTGSAAAAAGADAAMPAAAAAAEVQEQSVPAPADPVPAATAHQLQQAPAGNATQHGKQPEVHSQQVEPSMPQNVPSPVPEPASAAPAAAAPHQQTDAAGEQDAAARGPHRRLPSPGHALEPVQPGTAPPTHVSDSAASPQVRWGCCTMQAWQCSTLCR